MLELPRLDDESKLNFTLSDIKNGWQTIDENNDPYPQLSRLMAKTAVPKREVTKTFTSTDLDHLCGHPNITRDVLSALSPAAQAWCADLRSMRERGGQAGVVEEIHD